MADARTGFRQPVCIEHHRVAWPEMEPAGHEMGLSRDAHCLTADRVDVVRAAVGIEQQWRRMTPAGKLDIKTGVALRHLAVDHGAEAITNVSHLLIDDGV